MTNIKDVSLSVPAELSDKADAQVSQLSWIAIKARALAQDLEKYKNASEVQRRYKRPGLLFAIQGLEEELNSSDVPPGYDGYAKWLSHLNEVVMSDV